VKRGLFIAFEGIDGTGKTTQLEMLADFLRSQNLEVIQTREPTDGTYGQKIRELYVDRGRCTIEEELDLFIQDRKEHVEELIAPALAGGKAVLTDRYYFSTAAYQGAAGCNSEAIFTANSFAPEPDIVLLLTMEAEVSVRRIQQLRGDTLNDFEQLEQLRKVAQLFTSFTQECIVRIDAAGTVEQVQAEIRGAVQPLLENTK
jgi:dTMP kinase